MRLLITGSRDWAEYSPIEQAIWIALGGRERYVPNAEFDWVRIVHGANPHGADALAERFARENGIWVERHPADWNQHGKGAGTRRNQEMVDLGADLCLAFIMPCSKSDCRIEKPHGSHGATHCRDAALAAGIRTISDERWRHARPSDFKEGT